MLSNSIILMILTIMQYNIILRGKAAVLEPRAQQLRDGPLLLL